ncbi:MAG: type I restriction-modification system subunit M N-terminal domain-containing protein [Sutterella sp.]|nr:type I restriction-modification system subunit M N-terminal domain-containing protein [Sutterella sp.]
MFLSSLPKHDHIHSDYIIADNKREQERAELHKAIWGIANDLHGSVDGWDFKNFVLGALFYRYVSENLTAVINKIQRETGEVDFDYTKKPLSSCKLVWCNKACLLASSM